VVQLQVDHETKTIYVAKSNDKVISVAFEMTAQGYSGPITVMLGVDRKGELLGVRVLSHTETPGLGDKIEAEKSHWIFGFDGLSLSNPNESQWKVKKDGGYFDQFTGATITPRAVVKAIEAGLELFKTHQGQLLAETQIPNAQPALKSEDIKSAPTAEQSATHSDASKKGTGNGNVNG
jgi:electron transport complex protein RnfG